MDMGKRLIDKPAHSGCFEPRALADRRGHRAAPGAGASGDASVQVCSPQRLAAVGDLAASLPIQQIIVEALAAACQPGAGLEDLPSQQDEPADPGGGQHGWRWAWS